MLFRGWTVEKVQELLEESDPALVSASRAAELVEAFARLERLAAAGKVLFAARAAESGNWAADGHRSPAAWLAAQQQGSLGDAISSLETSKRLEDQEETRDALRSGKVSSPQAQVIAMAAETDPSCQGSLIHAAATESHRGLKQRAREVMARAASAEEELERYRQIRSSRYLRHWTDYDGALRLDAKLTPETGARVLSAVGAEADAIFNSKRDEGERESTAAYRADALVALVTGDAVDQASSGTSAAADDSCNGTSRRHSRSSTDTVVIRVDAAALRRGHLRGEELCEVAGVGPVPVATARALLGDAFVKLLVRDSVDVLSVCHVGRLVPAHLRSALEERDPVCVVPGCDVAFGLEIHHWSSDYADCKTTSLEGICRICAAHHDKITYEGFTLTGGAEAWRLESPATGSPDSSTKFDDSG